MRIWDLGGINSGDAYTEQQPQQPSAGMLVDEDAEQAQQPLDDPMGVDAEDGDAGAPVPLAAQGEQKLGRDVWNQLEWAPQERFFFVAISCLLKNWERGCGDVGLDLYDDMEPLDWGRTKGERMLRFWKCLAAASKLAFPWSYQLVSGGHMRHLLCPPWPPTCSSPRPSTWARCPCPTWACCPLPRPIHRRTLHLCRRSSSRLQRCSCRTSCECVYCSSSSSRAHEHHRGLDTTHTGSMDIIHHMRAHPLGPSYVPIHCYIIFSVFCIYSCSTAVQKVQHCASGACGSHPPDSGHTWDYNVKTR